MDKVGEGDLITRIQVLNGILHDLGVDIGANISGAYGGYQLVGFNGSVEFSRTGHIPKRELYNQLNTLTTVLFEVSRQVRAIQNT